jgi:hypothetical protein
MMRTGRLAAAQLTLCRAMHGTDRRCAALRCGVQTGTEI